MDYAYSDLVEHSKQWAQQAAAAGWVSNTACAALDTVDTRSPDTLFTADADAHSRPLIVAFLGGTGVGKSSLLNRLAGAPIAKAGVERPTSKEVTLYHHHSINIAQLPPDLPIEKVKMAHHSDNAQRLIVWIDMPDFDSTEHGNKQQVLQWLPHIDILVYVVSPERYRDNKAWRILQAEGGKHAWLFVLNQWDRGQPAQYDDFARQLHLAGFENPLVMRTVCDGSAADDEFMQLRATIASLATGHTVEQLEQRGLQLKKIQLQQALRLCLTELGTKDAFQTLVAAWPQRWAATADLLRQALAWPLQCKAGFYAAREGDLIAPKALPKVLAPKSGIELWDDWTQCRFEDALDETILHADQLQLPVLPLKQSLLPLRAKAEKILAQQTELAARAALAKPGNGVQRFFLKLARTAEIVLPLAAMGWASVQALQGYYQSGLTHNAYLGIDFAVHTVLLIGLSWLTPYFVQKKIQPSLRKTALVGLKRGMQAALSRVDVDVVETLQNFERQRSEFAASGERLIALCAVERPAHGERYDTLSRMLLSE
jgi:hypothetical protein